MTTIFKSITSKVSNQLKKTNRLHVRFFPVIIISLFLFSSCSKDNTTQGNTDNTLVCKNKPGQILFGRDISDIKYNAQDKPITITTTQYDPGAPAQPPVISVYKIEYTPGGKAGKVTRTVNNQTELYYQMEYNSTGQLINNPGSMPRVC